MNRFGFDAVGSYVLSVALATLLVAILATRLQKSKSAFASGLAVALISFLLGCIVPVACFKASGYSVISDNLFIVGDSQGEGASPPARQPESASPAANQPPAEEQADAPK